MGNIDILRALIRPAKNIELVYFNFFFINFVNERVIDINNELTDCVKLENLNLSVHEYIYCSLKH